MNQVPSKEDSNSKLLKSVNLSGFPLQLAIERQVNNLSGWTGWRVAYTEHSWINNEGTSGFADVILEHCELPIRMVIECKRIRQDEKQKPLIFISTPNTTTRNSKCFLAECTRSKVNNEIEVDAQNFQWSDLILEPSSSESMYCVFQDSGNEKTVIDRAASELVTATEAIAGEQFSYNWKNHTEKWAYVTVIVTNAPLKLCICDAEGIDIAQGAINEAKFTDVEFIRYRKQLSNNHRPQQGEELTTLELSLLKENTVFVVNSSAFKSFIAGFSINPNHLTNQVFFS